MRWPILCAALLFGMPTAAGAQQPDAAATTDARALMPDAELDRMTKEVASQLRCVVCRGLSIQDSPSPLAQEMRALVREQLAQGRSPDEVKEYFVARYGEWVLLRPKPRGFNLLVYMLPIAILLAGGAFVYTRARKWTSGHAPADSHHEEEEIEAGY